MQEKMQKRRCTDMQKKMILEHEKIIGILAGAFNRRY